MVDPSLSDTRDVLTSIWERVLSRKSVRTDDDFFDLGGNAFLAFKLFMEIEERFDLTLPAATICAAPTVAALAALLKAPSTPGPLVSLKPGSGGPPIFLCPGIGGSVIDLVPLARRMQSNQPIYGMEPLGNYGAEDRLERIEDTAEFFLAAIRQLQPRGPYFLVGYSLGGLVTLEIAQRLRAKGEDIALLAMLDSYPDRRQLSFTQHARLALQLARLRLAHRIRKNPPNRSEVRNHVSRQWSNPSPAEEKHSIAMERLKDAQYRALRNYRPRRYNGRIYLVRAAVPTYFPSDPAPVWRRMAKELEIVTVPGDHVGIITTHIDDLAAVVTSWVQQAFAAK